MSEKTVTLRTRVKLPEVPSHLVLTDGGTKVSVSRFTDEDLQAVGDAWTRQLITNAKRSREFKDAL